MPNSSSRTASAARPTMARRVLWVTVVLMVLSGLAAPTTARFPEHLDRCIKNPIHVPVLSASSSNGIHIHFLESTSIPLTVVADVVGTGISGFTPQSTTVTSMDDQMPGSCAMDLPIAMDQTRYISCNRELYDSDLQSPLTLSPGTYCWSVGDFNLNNGITFDGQGQEEPTFLLKFTAGGTVRFNSQISLVGGARPRDILWFMDVAPRVYIDYPEFNGVAVFSGTSLLTFPVVPSIIRGILLAGKTAVEFQTSGANVTFEWDVYVMPPPMQELLNCRHFTAVIDQISNYQSTNEVVLNRFVGYAPQVATTSSMSDQEITNLRVLNMQDVEYCQWEAQQLLIQPTRWPCNMLSQPDESLSLVPGSYCIQTNRTGRSITLDGENDPVVRFYLHFQEPLYEIRMPQWLVLAGGLTPDRVFWLIQAGTTILFNQTGPAIVPGVFVTGELSHVNCLETGFPLVFNSQFIGAFSTQLSISANTRIYWPGFAEHASWYATVDFIAAPSPGEHGLDACKDAALHVTSVSTNDYSKSMVVQYPSDTVIFAEIIYGTIEPSSAWVQQSAEKDACFAAISAQDMFTLRDKYTCTYLIASAYANLILTPGIYCYNFPDYTNWVGSLVLDGQHSGNASFMFMDMSNVYPTLDFAASVTLVNGSRPELVTWIFASAYLTATTDIPGSALLPQAHTFHMASPRLSGQYLVKNYGSTATHEGVVVAWGTQPDPSSSSTADIVSSSSSTGTVMSGLSSTGSSTGESSSTGAGSSSSSTAENEPSSSSSSTGSGDSSSSSSSGVDASGSSSTGDGSFSGGDFSVSSSSTAMSQPSTGWAGQLPTYSELGLEPCRELVMLARRLSVYDKSVEIAGYTQPTVSLLDTVWNVGRGFIPNDTLILPPSNSTSCKQAILNLSATANETLPCTSYLVSAERTTITPGVHCISSWNLEGTLVFDGQWQSNPMFIIKSPATWPDGTLVLRADFAATYVLLNGVSPSNIIWLLQPYSYIYFYRPLIGTVLSPVATSMSIILSAGAGSMQGQVLMAASNAVIGIQAVSGVVVRFEWGSYSLVRSGGLNDSSSSGSSSLSSSSGHGFSGHAESSSSGMDVSGSSSTGPESSSGGDFSSSSSSSSGPDSSSSTGAVEEDHAPPGNLTWIPPLREVNSSVPGPSASDPTATVLLVVSQPSNVTFDEAFAETAALELAKLTGYDNTGGLVITKVTVTNSSDDQAVGGVTAVITAVMSLTSAQILQQWMDVGGGVTLDPLVFPIFSSTRQMVINLDPVMPVVTGFDLTCNNGTNCRVNDTCTLGLCGCPRDASGFCPLDYFAGTTDMVCASGSFSLYADACVSINTTVDHMSYNQGETCESRHPSFHNAFPTRRYCQNMVTSLHTERHMLVGLMGDPNNIKAPLHIFTINSPYSLTELALPPHRDIRTGIVSFRGYVSNLYDGKQPVNNKAWALIEFKNAYTDRTVQLTRLAFLDGIEGSRECYFGGGNQWRCLTTGPAGVYVDAEDEGTIWRCLAYHVWNPRASRCEPGCDTGLMGPRCDQPLKPYPECAIKEWNATTTLYLSQDCLRVECQWGYLNSFGTCEPDPYTVTYPYTDVVRLQSSGGGDDDTDIGALSLPVFIAVLLGSVGGTILAMVGTKVGYAKWQSRRPRGYAKQTQVSDSGELSSIELHSPVPKKTPSVKKDKKSGRIRPKK